MKELSTGLRTKQFSSREITRAYLDAIRRDTLNAFISINDRAEKEAAHADQMRAAGQNTDCTGIPIAVKDILTVQGMVTTAASKMLKNYVAPYTATAVKRLTDQGMVILGKTNLDEFAMGSSNENSAFGPVKNPYDEARVAGGSSGGSAAAVAARLAPIALGSDTGGSVRLPASFCGILGLKPTYGRVSRYGLIAMASSLDQVGIFARTAHDCAYLLREISGHDPRDATSSVYGVDDYAAQVEQPIGKVTVGLPKEYFSEHADTDMEQFINKTIERYRTVPNVRFKEVTLPLTPYVLAVYYIIMPSEVSANMARYDGLRYGFREDRGGTLKDLYKHNRSKGLGPEVKRRIMLGTFSLSAGYIDQYYAKASKVRTLLKRDFERVFHEVDCILTPTAPTPAFRLGEKLDDPLTMYLSDIYTVSANLVGIPALTFPIGFVRNLPVGLQLMGPAWSEGQLLQVAHHLMQDIT